MSILGLYQNTCNPQYTIEDFVFWMRSFKNYMSTSDGVITFNKLYKIANSKIFYSIFGTDWEQAMSLCIAHYMYLIAANNQAPSGSDLSSIVGGGAVKGVITSASIGDFSKTFDVGLTVVDSLETKFWNQSSYGQQLVALYKTKGIPSVFVVTSDNVCTPPSHRLSDAYEKWKHRH